MPDTKVSLLTALTGANAATGDLLHITDVSAGTSGSKSITVSELRIALGLPKYEVVVTRSATQSISNNNFTTPINWDGEAYDPDNLFTASLTYVTVPSGVTTCEVTARLEWASSSTGNRWFSVGETNTSDVTTFSFGTDLKAATFESGHSFSSAGRGWTVTPGNRIKLFPAQSSGGNLNVTIARMQLKFW